MLFEKHQVHWIIFCASQGSSLQDIVDKVSLAAPVTGPILTPRAVCVESTHSSHTPKEVCAGHLNDSCKFPLAIEVSDW